MQLSDLSSSWPWIFIYQVVVYFLRVSMNKFTVLFKNGIIKACMEWTFISNKSAPQYLDQYIDFVLNSVARPIFFFLHLVNNYMRVQFCWWLIDGWWSNQLHSYFKLKIGGIRLGQLFKSIHCIGIDIIHIYGCCNKLNKLEKKIRSSFLIL